MTRYSEIMPPSMKKLSLSMFFSHSGILLSASAPLSGGD
jgi:hypothetical protein